MPIGPLDGLAVDDWETMVDVNIKGDPLYMIALWMWEAENRSCKRWSVPFQERSRSKAEIVDPSSPASRLHLIGKRGTAPPRAECRLRNPVRRELS